MGSDFFREKQIKTCFPLKIKLGFLKPMGEDVCSFLDFLFLAMFSILCDWLASQGDP